MDLKCVEYLTAHGGPKSLLQPVPQLPSAMSNKGLDLTLQNCDQILDTPVLQ